MINRIFILPTIVFCCFLTGYAQIVVQPSPEKTNSAERIAADEKKSDATSLPEAQKTVKNPSAAKDVSVEKNTPDKTFAPDSTEAEKKSTSIPVARRIGVDVSAPVSLTLEDAVRMTLENNNDIRAVETNVRRAEFELKAARGAFDPVFSTENYFERSTVPVASSLEGGANGKLTQTDFRNSFRVGGFAPRFGGSYNSEFSASRTTTNSQFNFLNPQFPSVFSLSYTQPLWRGLRTDENRRRIEVAKKNISLSDAQFRQRAIETVERAQAAYWDLTFALKNLQVQQEAVKSAQAQLESNQRQVAEGVLAPIDVVQAETQVANFKQNLYAAEEAAAAADNALKTLILPAREHPFWQQALIPVSPVDPNVPRTSLDDALKTAIANRPEIAQAAISREINQINNRFLRDQTKPRVDLIASYTAQGLAGKFADNGNLSNLFVDSAVRERVDQLSNLAGLPNLPPVPTFGTGVPANLQGGYGRSLGNLFGQNYPTFRVGVRVEIPLGNRTARAELGRGQVEETRLEYERRQTEQTITAEVRNAVQSLLSAEARVKAATEARSAAEKQFESERRQFIGGTSTTFLVLERQTAFVAAQGRELEAQTQLNKASANLNRVIGRTLEANGVALSN